MSVVQDHRLRGSRTRISVGGIVMSFVLAMVIGISGVIAPGGVAALGASTALTIIGGDVQVSSQGGPFEAARDGAILSPGDIIRTGVDARAVLTYFEGSTVAIEPSSELAISEAHASPDGSTVVVMTQNFGRTWHVVTKLISGGSKYEVRTPAATASVRGTAFEVGVAQQANGESTTAIITTEGAVAAAARATAALPEPEPVIVPAGFQTTSRSTERKPEAPVLVPEPERRVTVNISNDNSVVVDPLGRSNGYKDGKLVLQTPGAQVQNVGGKLTITLPNLPDGKVSTVVGQQVGTPASSVPDVEVVTTVEERGKAPATVTETVKPTEQRVTGVEVKKSGPGAEATPNLRRVGEDEKKDLKTPKTAAEPERTDGADKPAPVFRPGLGPDPKLIQKIVEERRAAAEKSESLQPSGARREETKSEEQLNQVPGFVPQLSFAGPPNAASQQRDDAKKEEKREEEVKKSETESKKSESDIKATKQLQKAAQVAEKIAEAAQTKAVDHGRKADEAKARAEQAARDAEVARAKAERELREAEERAAKAASEAARRAAQDEAAKKAAARQRALQEQNTADAARRKAEAEALEQARQQAKARQAEEAARELRVRLEKQLETLQQQQSSSKGRNST